MMEELALIFDVVQIRPTCVESQLFANPDKARTDRGSIVAHRHELVDYLRKVIRMAQ